MYVMLKREAKEAGLALNWPARLPNTRRALVAAEWARQHCPDMFPQFHKCLFDAHFVLGEDLEDPAVVDRHEASRALISRLCMRPSLMKAPRQRWRRLRRLAENTVFKERQPGWWPDN